MCLGPIFFPGTQQLPDCVNKDRDAVMNDAFGWQTARKLICIGASIDLRLTVTSVDQVGPDDHLLRETEDTETASLECGVEDVAGIGHHVLSFKDTQADQVDLGSMEQEPTVGHLLLPPDIARIFPE